MHKKTKLRQAGLSMIEVLTVITILALLIIAAISQLPKQLDKAKDGKRKSDLQKIKIAYENYFNDEGCYPTQEILDNCGSSDLAPYLKEIPCDPRDEQPYIYYPEPEPTVTACPQNYRVWSALYRDDDPQSAELNCGTSDGCGLTLDEDIVLIVGTAEEAAEYNYGVSEGVPVSLGTVAALTEGVCCSMGGDCNSWNIETSGECHVGPFVNDTLCKAYPGCS